MTDISEAISEVERFLDERQRMGGLDHEDIVSIQVGSEREAHLYQSHLRALLDAARPQARKCPRCGEPFTSHGGETLECPV